MHPKSHGSAVANAYLLTLQVRST